MSMEGLVMKHGDGVFPTCFIILDWGSSSKREEMKWMVTRR